MDSPTQAFGKFKIHNAGTALLSSHTVQYTVLPESSDRDGIVIPGSIGDFWLLTVKGNNYVHTWCTLLGGEFASKDSGKPRAIQTRQ